jgi:uncharacterized membrane protein
MKGRIGRLTEALAANLWLIPLLAFGLAFGLSRGLVELDRNLSIAKAWFAYGGSPSGARQLLATVAGSMITFIGLVCSSTILVLQLASSQFSPRIMRSFFRDRVIQTALGTFIATFAYAILVLREIREDPANPFVPSLSTYVAISLVWLSLAMFVIYINHIGQRIRAVNIIKTAAAETVESLDRLHSSRPPRATFVTPSEAPCIVAAPKHGVVASIDATTLVRFGAKRDAVFEIVPLPGDFLCTGSPMVRIWCSHQLSSKEIEKVAGSVSIERERTMREDALFGFRQLVDIANKALSPGIDDPTTAVQVLDELHELLRRVAVAEPRPDVNRGQMCTRMNLEAGGCSFRGRHGSSTSITRWKKSPCTGATRSMSSVDSGRSSSIWGRPWPKNIAPHFHFIANASKCVSMRRSKRPRIARPHVACHVQ